MAKIYIEVFDSIVQDVYTDAKGDFTVVVCDRDDAEAEQKYEAFDVASEACQELDERKKVLHHIY